MCDTYLISLNHPVQSLTTGLIANNAPIRPMQALLPPCTRHILSLYEERMQRRSGTTLSIGFSLHPFLNDRFAEHTDLFIFLLYCLRLNDCLSVCIALRCVLCKLLEWITLSLLLLCSLMCKPLVCKILLAVSHVVRCANHWSAGAKPLQVPPPSLGKGVGGWGYRD